MTTANINGNQYSDDSATGTRNLDNGGHRLWFLPLIQDVVTEAARIQTDSLDATNAAAVAEASLATLLSITGGTLGIGSEPFDMVRNSDLGSMAYLDEHIANGIYVNTQNTTYQINITDKAKLLLTTSGTNTWTLPLLSDLPIGWFVRYKNRSGNNLTVNRAGSDTINAAATSLTLATGTQGIIARSGVATWESF